LGTLITGIQTCVGIQES